MKKVCALILSLILVFTLIPMQAFASETTIVEIEGHGTFEFDESTGTITKATDLSGSVVIPSEVNGVPVTKIAEDAFVNKLGRNVYNNENITSVELPDTIAEIGNSAFYRCSKLTSVKLPSELTTIPDSCFCACYELKYIYIPRGVRTIGKEAFSHTSLESIDIPSSVKSIGKSAFYSTDLTEVTIPAGVSALEDYTFPKTVTRIYIPASVITLNDECLGYRFSDQIRNTTIYCPAGSAAEKYAKEKGYNVENKYYHKVSGGCIYIDESTGSVVSADNTVTDVSIPASVNGITIKAIGEMAFVGCSSLKSVSAPYVSVIGAGAFANCPSLTNLTLGSSITEIPIEMCAYCTALSSISIPSSVTKIAGEAFSGCTTLSSVTIPASLKELSDDAFAGCNNTKFYTSSGQPVTLITDIYIRWNGVTYDGEEHQPEVTVIDVLGNVIEPSNYEVTYPESSKDVGEYKASVKITGSGFMLFCPEETDYVIEPEGTAIASTKKYLNKVTLTWNKQTKQTDGYQIRYSTKSDMSSEKTSTITDKTKNSKTISSLKSGTKYYFQIRTYKTVGDKKIYSDWSAKKSATTIESSSGSKLNRTSMSVAKGYSKTLKLSSYKSKITWSSTNKRVATVSSTGKVKGVNLGTCYIKCKTADGKVRKCKVTVKKNQYTTTPSKEFNNYGGPIVRLKKAYYSNGKLVVEALVLNDRIFYASKFDHITLKIENYDDGFATIAKQKFYNVPINLKGGAMKTMKFTFTTGTKKKINLREAELYLHDDYWYTYVY